MKQFFILKYLSALELVGFFIKTGVTCTVVPIHKESARVLFPRGTNVDAARKNLSFLKTLPVQEEV